MTRSLRRPGESDGRFISHRIRKYMMMVFERVSPFRRAFGFAARSRSRYGLRSALS